MGRHFNLPLASVFLDDRVLVDRETAVGVNSDAKQSRVGL